MLEKYRFNFEEFDKCCVDDMIWVFENLVIGYTDNGKHHVLNHYNKSFDLSEYKKVDLSYSHDDFILEYMDWCFKEPSGWYL